jgi:hypothetical protein
VTEILKEAGIYVCRDDRTIRADAIAQPTNNRTRTGPDLQTSPTISNTKAE